jgi:5-oxoprolinase (ATP-hydrolysing)
VRTDVPLNEGLLDEVEIVTESGILDPPLTRDPKTCPAVVGGNVETSQRVVDVLLEALGLQAHGQGTMNNFLFGNERFGFYETIGGGAGAGPGWHGRSGGHVHMTNTAIKFLRRDFLCGFVSSVSVVVPVGRVSGWGAMD